MAVTYDAHYARKSTDNAQSAKSGKKGESYFDYVLLITVICLAVFGVLMIYSASYYVGQKQFDNPTFFLRNQLRNLAIGAVGMIATGFSKFNYRSFLKKIGPMRFVSWIYAMALIFQIAVLFIGEEVNYSKRWIRILGIQFQPAEVSKIAIILLVASYIFYSSDMDLSNVVGIFRVAFWPAVIILFVAVENLSSAIIMCVIVFGMCFVVAKRKLLYFLVMVALPPLGFLAIKALGGYHSTRIDAWLNVETHPKGFQTLQGLYAIATGGLKGVGLGESIQKLGKIPEPYNDMIFSVICEELGVIGAVAVLLMFAILLWRIYTIAVTCRDRFASMICVGVMIHIAIQVILNVAVVTNVIPNTGVSLPFISYGGSSVIFLMTELGIVLGISRNRDRM